MTGWWLYAMRPLWLAIGMLAGFTFGASAQVSSKAFAGFASSGEPIQLEADQLRVIDEKGMAILTGNVSVIQGVSLLKTRKLTVYYDQTGENSGLGGNIKRLEANDTIYVKSEDRNVTADSGIFDMQTDMITLNGNVVMSQGENVAKGCILTINMKTNLTRLDPCGGRVKILLTPGQNN